MSSNYQSLRYFIEIAHCLNFSHAAQKLHISQPGLSQQIAALEKELGIKLLLRSTRNVKLTAEGEYLYKSLLPSFENIDKTVEEIKEEGGVPQPTLRIATVPSAASNMLPELIKKIKASKPSVNFHIKETTTIDAIELVQTGDYHLAFVRTPITMKQMIQKPFKWMEFAKFPLQVVVALSHEVASRESINLYDLRHETFLHYDPIHSPSLYQLLEYACLTAGFIPKVIGTGPEILTIANLISNGIGITLMPRDMLQLLKSYPIKGIDIENLLFYSSISAIWNEAERSSTTKLALQIMQDFDLE